MHIHLGSLVVVAVVVVEVAVGIAAALLLPWDRTLVAACTASVAVVAVAFVDVGASLGIHFGCVGSSLHCSLPLLHSTKSLVS